MNKESLFSKCAAEFLGIFVIIFLGCGSLMISARFPGALHANLPPVIFGLAVMIMIYAVGHISGAHFNPAVTLAFAAARHFPLRQVVFYWIAQMAGAFFALYCLVQMLPPGTEFGAAYPASQVSAAQVFLWEMVLSFILMFIIIAVAADTRAEGTMAGVAIGLTVAVNSWVGGVLTGASMNPVRFLAPAFFQNLWQLWWIYLSAPFLGAVLAALLYEKIKCHDETKSSKGCC